ncbi:hypothetical protein ONZ45_g10235 [Pleurotus djamor]|nr:hypothetical protein ONZ45_g10235 [Pleurotus djamor]
MATKTSKQKKERDTERNVQTAPPTNERLKAVVRRLPPNLPEEIFWGSVQAWVADGSVNWKIYYPGKASKRLGKENTPSRAFIAFKNEDQLATFSREYDGHLFRDKAGNEYQAVVEFAPYQKVPSERKKPDARNATIEKDDDYVSFIEALNASKEKPESVSLETLIASTQPAPAPTTTPLLEALKAEKSAAKDREAILRNHPHYNIRKNEAKKPSPGQNARPEPENKRGGPPPKATGPPPNAQTPTPVKPPQGQQKPSLSGGSNSNAPPQVKPPKPPKNRGKQAASGDAAPSAADSAPPAQAGPSKAQSQTPGALSGVGVSRKREKDDNSTNNTNEEAKDGAETPKATPQTPTTPNPPRSPRRRRKEGGGGGGNEAGEVRVPGILQRIDAPQLVSNEALTARIDAAPPPPNFGPPPRGGHPGRGRGRGRGGPPRGG